MLKRAGLWLRSNLQRRRYEQEMRDEMNEHLDRATTLLMKRGLGADEARRQARREFGDVAYHQTEARDARGTLWLDDIMSDSRFALRHFARKPGITMMMFVVLAVGISISTLLFSWVHGIAVMPPPAVTRDSDLVRIRGSSVSGPSERSVRHFEEDEFLAYRNLTSHFSAVAGWIDRTGVLQLPGDAERRGHSADLTFVSESYFQVLGTQPVLGGGLPAVASDDPTALAVGVIDHQTWKDLFAQRRDVIGQTVLINGQTITIVGVGPERFNGARILPGIQIWLPLAARHAVLGSPDVDYSAVARLRPGVTPEAATIALQTIAARFDTAAAGTDVGRSSTEVVPVLAANHDPGFEHDLGMIALLIGALGTLVLLVTCTNVSALLTGLASARRQEIAVRLSLGAARMRIIRQLLTESVVLAVIAGAAALGLVALLLRLAVTMMPEFPIQMTIEWPTMAFTFGTALAVGVFFGLSPALHATRLALASVLRDSSSGIASSRARLQRGLVVAQIAFTQPLIVLMATTLLFVTAILKPSTGSDSADQVILLGVQTPSSLDSDFTPESMRLQREMMMRLRDRMRESPGVDGAVIQRQALSHPGEYTVRAGDEAGGTSSVTVSVAVQNVEGAHFDVLGIPLISGRTFSEGDVSMAATESETPVIIGTDLATRVWGPADAVGRRLQITPDSAADMRTLVVVGVVDDPLARTRVSGESYRVYHPLDVNSGLSEWMLIRTTAAAAPMLPAIRGLVQQTAANTIVSAQTLAESEVQHNSVRRRVSGGISAAGIAALILSAIGLYAVIAFSVEQRTHEIAVRLAVGARGSQIAGAFLGDGLRLGAFGLLLGLPAAMFAMQKLVASFAMGDLPLAPIILIASTGVSLVAAASAWGPARRAAAVDPATALRRG